MRTRILIVAVVILVAGSILADPYTFHLNGSDAVVPAPLWQTNLALLDAALLIASAVLVLLQRPHQALVAFAGELVYALGYNAVLIYRDGSTRFIWGFGAERHFVDFYVSFGLRLLVLVALFWSIKRAQVRAA